MGPEIFLLFVLFLSLASLALTIWAIIEIATKPFKREKDKVIWIIIVLVLGLVGPLLYLAKRKSLLAAPMPEQREYLPPLEDNRERLYNDRTGDADQYV